MILETKLNSAVLSLREYWTKFTFLEGQRLVFYGETPPISSTAFETLDNKFFDH